MTLNLNLAGLWSVSPFAVARTLNLCFPGLTLYLILPELQAFQFFLSSLHLNVEPATVEVNLNFAVPFFASITFFFFGCLVIAVSGVTGGGAGLKPTGVENP